MLLVSWSQDGCCSSRHHSFIQKQEAKGAVAKGCFLKRLSFMITNRKASLKFFSMFPWDYDIWQSLCGKKRKMGKQTSGHFPFSKVESKKEGSWRWLLSDSVCFFNDFLIHLFTGAAQALSSCDEEGLLSSCGSQASFCGCWGSSGGSTGSRAPGLCSYGTRAQWPLGTWDLPGPGMEPMSPELAGSFSTIWPPGKSWTSI